ncbi:MAG: hypothetical protein CSYNP_03222 [Syntrophus sp. SKADARSKE-3]|nr:hypothetical protein [Syntrophus sp. SKADARSKE-3]
MKRRTKGLIVLLGIMMFLSGCSTFGWRYGAIVIDDAVRKNFEAFHMDPGMNYYYSGPDAAPNVLMGLKKDYLLDNDLWKPIEPNPKIFKEIIRSMQDKGMQFMTLQHGFVIKDDRGKPIGVWYSIFNIKPLVVKMGEGNKVDVYTPELDIYHETKSSGGDGGMR